MARGNCSRPACPLIASLAAPGPRTSTSVRMKVSARAWIVPDVLILILSSPLPLALAARIAWRSDPDPESRVFVTLKVAAPAALPVTSTRNAQRPDETPRRHFSPSGAWFILTSCRATRPRGTLLDNVTTLPHLEGFL